MKILHHLASVHEVRLLLGQFARWARCRVIVVDVLDPRDNLTAWDWMRDAYYRRFLGDVGNAFMSRATIERLLNDAFPDDEWQNEFSVAETVGGKLAIWVASRKSHISD